MLIAEHVTDTPAHGTPTHPPPEPHREAGRGPGKPRSPAAVPIDPLPERPQIEVVQRHRGATGRPEPVVGLGVAGHRVDLRLRLLGRLHPDVAVAGDTGTGRDEL